MKKKQSCAVLFGVANGKSVIKFYSNGVPVIIGINVEGQKDMSVGAIGLKKYKQVYKKGFANALNGVYYEGAYKYPSRASLSTYKKVIKIQKKGNKLFLPTKSAHPAIIKIGNCVSCEVSIVNDGNWRKYKKAKKCFNIKKKVDVATGSTTIKINAKDLYKNLKYPEKGFTIQFKNKDTGAIMQQKLYVIATINDSAKY